MSTWPLASIQQEDLDYFFPACHVTKLAHVTMTEAITYSVRGIGLTISCVSIERWRPSVLENVLSGWSVFGAG